MDRLPNPTWLRSFETAARHLNFTITAKELGLTQTAVSLHIRSLEAELGQKLFTRNARRLELTELGQSYSLTVRRALGDIALSTNSLFGPASRQTLTIRARFRRPPIGSLRNCPSLPHAIRKYLCAWSRTSGMTAWRLAMWMWKSGWAMATGPAFSQKS